MSRQITIPPWVPHGVKATYEFAELNNDVAQRLLADERMEQAWKDLKSLSKSVGSAQRIEKIRQGFFLHHYDESVENFTDFDYQAASLFHQVMVETHQPARTYWTAGDAAKLAQPFLNAAKLCDEAHSYDFTLHFNEELQQSLAVVKSYFREQARMLQMRDNPRVLGRRLPGVSDEKRGHARMIATIIRALFSPPPDDDFPHSAVARLMAVSLAIDDDVLELKDSVRSWCRDLPPEKDSLR